MRRHEVYSGFRDGVTSEERDRIKALEREVKELRRANEILKQPKLALNMEKTHITHVNDSFVFLDCLLRYRSRTFEWYCRRRYPLR